MSPSKCSLQEDLYYGPLIDTDVRKILKSGYLLDEDLECLLNEFVSIDSPPPQSYNVPSKLLLSLSTVLISGILSKKYSPWVLPPSLLTTTIVAGYEVRRHLTKSKQARLIDTLIEVIQKKLKLHSHIIRYLRVRGDAMKNEISADALTNRKMNAFMHRFSESQVSYFRVLLGHLQTISFFSDQLSEDCVQLGSLEFSDRSIENSLEYSIFTNDLQILLHSKLLSYIGLVLCSKSSKLTRSTIEVFLNKRIPQIIDFIQQSYNETKKEFDHIRTSATQYAEYKQKSKSDKRFVHSKLANALVDAVNNISIILEKSQGILERIDDDNDKTLESAIQDLRAHSLATYESIDLICRLYGIVTHSQPEKVRGPPRSSVINKTDEEKISTIHYDDIVEPREEKYVLYLEKDDNVTVDEDSRDNLEERSGAYLSLMLKELQKSLKQHQRFIEARKRRSSDGTSDEEVHNEPEPILRFRLETVEIHEAPKERPRRSASPDNRDVKPPVPLPRSGMKTTEDADHSSAKAMPPPPPLPNFNLGGADEASEGYGTKSMLEKIVSLSKQRNVKEEVFVISDSDSD
ncbi:unnamed protein product [Callosobruchus maculatus]|uniref:Vezatin n=1 Tax=Callosobruchus maculatus TaxID=64391 RepID=A0A653CDT8_CALMS|nr:unnamed protein product [Callosobruchus maculatus]